MKKITSYLNLLAVSVALFAGVSPANAVLKGFSPNATYDGTPSTFAAGAMPTWFQGQDLVAVQPCIVPGFCAVAASAPLAGTFDGFTFPMTFPTNYSEENFYFNVQTPDVSVGAPALGIQANVLAALEYMTINPVTGAPAFPTPTVAIGVFQRLRLQVIGLDPTGIWTVNHPWGTTTFNADDPAVCKKSGTGCKMTIDIPAALAKNSFGPSLGIPAVALTPDLFTMDTFLKSVTAPAGGWLGDAASTSPFTGGTVRNSFQVTGPPGVTPVITAAIITGKTVGLEISPQGVVDYGVVKRTPGAVTKTFTLNNLAGVAITPAIIANVPGTATVSPDFIFAPSLVTPCPTGIATLAPGATCNFDIVFSPTTVDGPKSATISVGAAGAASASVPAALVQVTGIADGTVPALAITGISKFTKSPTQTISGTVSDLNGVAGVTVSIDGAAPAAVTTLDKVAGTWTFATPALPAQLPNALPGVGAHSISVIATDNAQSTAIASLGGNLGTAVDSITVDNTVPAVAVTTPAAGLFTNNNKPAVTFTVNDINLAATTLKVDGVITSAAAVSPATLAPLADGPHNVTIDANDSAGNITSVTNNFTVDTVVPVIAVNSPAVNATTPTAPTIGVTAPVLTVTINDKNFDPINTKVTLDGNPVVFTTATNTLPNGDIVTTLSTAAPLAQFAVGAPQHTMTFAATDLAGNIAPTQALNFTLLLADGSMTSLGAKPASIADVILALKVAIGGFPEVAGITATTDTFKHGDVAPLDATGKPAPDGTIDLNDVLTILKKVVGLTTTF